MLAKLFFAKIAQNSDFPARINSRDLGQRETEDPYACPAPARTGKDLALRGCRIPKRPIPFATAAGPQRDPLDCQASSRLNVTATGNRQARSISSGVRLTDDAMACAGTLDWPMTKAQSPSAEQTCDDKNPKNTKEVSAVHGTKLKRKSLLLPTAMQHRANILFRYAPTRALQPVQHARHG
jgi:hypothetical protein